MAKQFCKKTEDGKVLLNTETMYTVFGISDRTLVDWQRNGCPKVERGWWDLKEVIKWRGCARPGDISVSPNAKKISAEADVKYAKARQEELKLQEMMGLLVPVEMVKAEISATFADIKQRLLKLPSDIRVEVYTLYPENITEITQIAEKTVRECLAELAGTDDKLTNGRAVERTAKKRGRPRKADIQPTAKADS